MELNELLDSIVEGDQVTKLKEDFCNKLRELDNRDFIKVFSALSLASSCDDEFDFGCDCDCDCEDCDCEDCDCDCDCK